MRVAFEVVKARREQLAGLLHQHGYLPLAQVCECLKISEATARRDLAALARDRVITRTYGGALMDFNQRFPSFRERLAKKHAAKYQIAMAALKQLVPGTTCFFDSGSTVYAVAQALSMRPVRKLVVVTNNLPVAEVLGEVKGIEVHLLGGQYLTRQSILLGDSARRSVRLWKFDLAVMGGEGMSSAGLWNSQQDVVLFQRTVMAQSRRSVFCLDASKLGREAPEFLRPWSEVDCLVTDATAEQLKVAGIRLKRNQLVSIQRRKHPCQMQLP
jgi:DeoR/GlpR family transcriptional regulator of sugar metabolism